MFRLFFRTIIMVLLVILFFYLWKNPEIVGKWLGKDQITQESANKAVNEIYSMIEELDLSPENVQDGDFTWKVVEEGGREEVEDVIVKGKSIRLFNISDDLNSKIRDYFEKYGFVSDAYNIASGTVSGIVGFIKGDTVCVVQSNVSDYDPNMEIGDLNESKSDVTIECGELEK